MRRGHPDLLARRDVGHAVDGRRQFQARPELQRLHVDGADLARASIADVGEAVSDGHGARTHGALLAACLALHRLEAVDSREGSGTVVEDVDAAGAADGNPHSPVAALVRDVVEEGRSSSARQRKRLHPRGGLRGGRGRRFDVRHRRRRARFRPQATPNAPNAPSATARREESALARASFFMAVVIRPEPAKGHDSPVFRRG